MCVTNVCARDEGGRERESEKEIKAEGGPEKGVAEPAMAPRARAFIIMIILDIPCPKQGQPASQPASLRNFPSFPFRY